MNGNEKRDTSGAEFTSQFARSYAPSPKMDNMNNQAMAQGQREYKKTTNWRQQTENINGANYVDVNGQLLDRLIRMEAKLDQILTSWPAGKKSNHMGLWNRMMRK